MGMVDAWQILRDGGLPVAAPRSQSRPTPGELARALCVAIPTAEGRAADALAAFIFAWHHHWPTTFATELGNDAARVLDWARLHSLDTGRYLKLRRISLENLAGVL